MDYMCMHKLTQYVFELDRTIEFHHETPIPFTALVTCMQIDSHLFFVLTLYPGCYILSVRVGTDYYVGTAH